VKSVYTPLASALVLEASACSLRRNDLDEIVVAFTVAPIDTILAFVVVVVVAVDDDDDDEMSF
jgi:hypothetical protein